MNVSLTRGLSLVLAISCGLLSLAILLPGNRVGTAQDRQPTAEEDQVAVEYAHNLSAAFRRAARLSTASVVKITSQSRTTGGGGGNPFQGTPFEDLFKDEMPDSSESAGRVEMGVGSGVIVDRSGIILTNNHVVVGADELLVQLNDGREFRTTDIHTDPRTDLAVIRIQDSGDLPVAKLGNSEDLEIGDWVIAIGSPFGLAQTVNAGIISGKGRGLEGVQRGEFLQTDAVINPGNSGGPLVNLDGEVIGINTAIASQSGYFQGVGFAIPVNQAKWVMTQLVGEGVVRRSYLGVSIDELTHDLAGTYGVGPREGVIVSRVFPETPASNAGLQEGDIITQVNETNVHSVHELQSTVERLPAESEQSLTVIRDGKQMAIRITLAELPNDFGSLANKPNNERPNSPNRSNEGVAKGILGVDVVALDVAYAEKLGLEQTSGVLISKVDPKGLAALSGIRPGMVILQVGKDDVDTVEAFQSAVENANLKDGITLLVATTRGNKFVTIRAE